MVNRLLARLSALGHTEASSIAVLVEAIEASGSIAVVNTERDPGFDLGVWSDDLEAIGGNPLLVEVKRSVVPGAIDQVLHGLADHVPLEYSVGGLTCGFQRRSWRSAWDHHG